MKKKTSNQNDSIVDPRFSKVHHDPRFQRLPSQRNQKIKIDKRFRGMLDPKDSAWNMNYVVDKYGRKVKKNTGVSLDSQYEVESDDEQEEDEEELEAIMRRKEGSRAKQDLREKKIEQGSTQDIQDEDVEDVSSSSSSSSEDELTGDEYQEEEEEKEKIPLGEPTRRLALVNMDWDRIRAVDLLVLLRSFVKEPSQVAKVTVYPSSFGFERLAKEAKYGPQLGGQAELDRTAKLVERKAQELEAKQEKKGGSTAPTNKMTGKQERADKIEEEEEEEEDEDEDAGGLLDGRLETEESGFDMELLRKYERERLKYYYAIVDFSDVKAAKQVYDECDGLEFESSANTLDFRFVPDAEKFEEAPRDEANEIPDKYTAPNFFTQSLQNSKVELTWDQGDPTRKAAMRKAIKGALEDDDLQAYLGSDESDVEPEKAADSDKTGKTMKYGALRDNLLADLRKELVDEEADVEVRFTPGLREAGERLAERADQTRQSGGKSAWQEQVDKMKSKKMQRKCAKMERDKQKQSGEEGQGAGLETVPDEVEDPFFAQAWQEATGAQQAGQPQAKQSRKSKKKDKEATEVDAEQEKQRAQLELLLDDGVTEERGYHLGGLIKRKKQLDQGASGKRPNKRRKQAHTAVQPAVADSSFKLDLADGRFQALTSSDFALDPTDPSFRATEGTYEVLAHVRKARHKQQQLEKRQAKQSKRKSKSGLQQSSPSSQPDHQNTEEVRDTQLTQLVAALRNDKPVSNDNSSKARSERTTLVHTSTRKGFSQGARIWKRKAIAIT